MLRSLITLLILASITSHTFVQEDAFVESFNDSDLLEVYSVPVKNGKEIDPVVDAKAAIVLDADSGVVLYAKNIHDPLPMASLTKIMTAVLILESHDLDEIVTIEDNYNAIDGDDIGVRVWLNQYEKITVQNLLTALLVSSAGDAALALAKYHSGSIEEFAEEMNEKARDLNLKNTNFINPVGVDAEGHYSSAFDLAILTKQALRFSTFRKIIKIEYAVVESTNGRIKHELNTTNHLLSSYLNIQGVKTGTTKKAGASVINLAVNSGGHEVISVLLNSPDRFQENKSLIDWIFRSYSW